MDYKIYAAAMIRNDADLILSFLDQCDELFDKVLLTDVQSTDGTLEAISRFAAETGKAKLFSLDKQEKYQSAITNCLARVAFAEGADWLFLLDADEFLNVAGRSDLQNYLRSFPDEVMHLPWINLIPSQYGDFTSFNVSQSFFWNGRVSKYDKIAISNLYIANNPNFYIHEGNHAVSPNLNSSSVVKEHDGLPLLHLPVRSADQFKYKMATAHKTLLTKHNRLPGEGSHVDAIVTRIKDSSSISDAQLNSIAAYYGETNSDNNELDPAIDEWPTMRLPSYVCKKENCDGFPHSVSLAETLQRDVRLTWNTASFAEGSPVNAIINGDNIIIKPVPISGRGDLFVEGLFSALPRDNPNMPSTVNSTMIVDAIIASFMRVQTFVFSAWSELVPTLFCLFSITRPRRFVELGTHNGMCFFAACQATQSLDLGTQCIAIDSWIGDPHASFHSKAVFQNFSDAIRTTFPDQFYIRALFDQALSCFEDESIDVLHIDGYHTYDAAKSDFSTWLPKMSQHGIILLHDIHVHERGFGVWRLWEELQEKYPTIDIPHCHGLGIVYVGCQPSAIAELIARLKSDTGHKQIVQCLLESVGSISIELGKVSIELRKVQKVQEKVQEEGRSQNDALRAQLKQIYRSRSWRITAPMRRLLSALNWSTKN